MNNVAAHTQEGMTPMARAKSQTGPLIDSDSVDPDESSTSLKIADDGFVSQPVISRKNDGPFLVGKSDIGTQRVITEADFASVGIKQSTLTFDWLSGYKIPIADISPEAVKFLTEKEYGFTVSDE